MSDRTLAAGLLVLLLAFPCSLLFGQAAAEYGALTGSSASITAKAASNLQHGTSRLVGHMRQTLSRPSQAAVRNQQRKSGAKGHPAAAAARTGSAGEMSIALVGDKDVCATPAIKSSSSDRANGLPTDCQRPVSKRKTQEKYPSAFNVSFGR